MRMAMRFCLPWNAVVCMLQAINIIFKKRNLLPNSKYQLLQYFPTQSHNFKYHVYCPNCKKYAGERSRMEDFICECGIHTKISETKSFFLELDLKNQLRNLLQQSHIIKGLEEVFNRRRYDDGTINDIFDGNMYKKWDSPNGLLNGRYNLSYTFNTDGCTTGKSSTSSVWPIYVMLNELPINMRSRNMILVGLWVDEHKPNMNIFLQPFVNQANELSLKGISWNLSDNVTITSLIIPLLCSVDSMARSAMLNMKQCNGKYGCTFCEHPTEGVSVTKGRVSRILRKYTVSTNIPLDRTDASIKRDMIKAYNAKDRNDINGIWGPSCLMNLHYFDLGDGFDLEYMHSCLLGVQRQYMDILLNSFGKDYYIGSPQKMDIINSRLMSIQTPKCITRTPRSLKDIRLWKASEWRSWTILYSLVCLRDVLSKKYIHHLALFVSALNILLQKSINSEMLETAHNLLIKFVVQFQSYFGKQEMSYNVHLLLHLCRSVRNWGPLWAHNTFGFENENRILLNLQTSPARVAVQVASRLLIYQSIPIFEKSLVISKAIRQFCDELCTSKYRVQNVYRNKNYVMIGTGVPYTLLPEEQECLGQIRVRECFTFKKIVCGGIRYTIAAYGHSKKKNDSVVENINGEIGIITNICKIRNDDGWLSDILFTRKVMLESDGLILTTNVKINHIKKCNLNDGTLFIQKPENIKRPCVILNCNSTFVCTIPYGCLGD